MATAQETERLHALVETGIAINSELSLDGVLERIVEAAARVTGARYAALGVIDPSGSGLERFVTYGMPRDVQTQIGDPPHGRGILGVLIVDARPLRLHDLSEDPRSVGFPPGHPHARDSKTGRVLERGRSERVDSLLEDPEVNQDVARRLGASTGLYVPIRAGDRPIGVLVAHDKIEREKRFASSDLRLAEQFALRASIAVDLSVAWRATRFAASSQGRKSSAGGSHASFTTRPDRP